MKKLFPLFLLFYFFSAHAANDTLTRAQVYNFNVGDTFDYEDCQIINISNTVYVVPCTFSRRIISALNYSADSDSLVITSTWELYSLNNPIANIDSLNYVEVFMDTPCPPNLYNYFYDSSQYNGRAINIMDNPCFEHGSLIGFANGIGMVFNYSWAGDPIDGFSSDSFMLIYYSKGTEKWGIPYYDFLTGINQPPTTPAIRIYPNPTTNIFFIEAAEPISKVEIIDVSGRIVQTQTSLKSKIEMNAANLSKGIYFCKIYFSQGFTTKKIVIE